MDINTNVYGAQNTWLDSFYLANGRMKTKCANFTGGNQLDTSSSLGVGNTVGKTPHNAAVDGSICFSALGNESYYSRLCYVNNTDINQDNEIATPFYYCENDRQNVLNGSVTISDHYRLNMWDEYSTETPNFSDLTVPIVELNPAKIVYVLQVICCDANGVEPTGTRWRFYGTYRRNSSNIRTNYPYIKAARLNPRIDNSNTETPNRVSSSSFSDAYQGFGIAINRDFTNIQNSALKLNYAQFRCITGDQCSIPLFGTDNTGIVYDPTYYNVLLCDPEDINFDTDTGHIDIRHQATDDFLDNIIRQAACFGVYFRAYDQNNGSQYQWDVATGELDAPAVFLGLLDDQGIGHGDYTQGAANRDNPIWNYSTYRDSPYDYTKPIDPTPYNKTTVFGNNDVANTFIKYWALSPAGVMALCDNIYSYINSVDTTTDDITKAITKTFYTNNPLDVIVGLKRFPFDIVDYVGYTGQSDSVKLGNLSTNIAGYPISGQYTVVNFGSYDVFPKFDDTFLDYMPYTYFELIIPFCGSVRLDPALFMGKKLQLKMIVDLYTGACTCYILANSLCIDSVSGNCSIDIPVSGIQSADFQNSVQNAITNVKNAKINQYAFNQRGNLAFATATLSGGSLGSPYMAVAGNVLQNMTTSLSSAMSLGTNITNAQKQSIQNDLDVSKAEYDLQHVQTPFNSVGSQSAANSFVEEMQARLIIYRPKFLAGWDSEIYGKTVGFACMLDGLVSSFHGYTVGTINLDGIDATNQEKQMIAAAFANGVYL